MITRKVIRVQFGNQKEIDAEIAKLQRLHVGAIVKPALKPVEIVDRATMDCNMLVDIIY